MMNTNGVIVDHDPGDEDRRPILGRKRKRARVLCAGCGQMRTVRVDGIIMSHYCGKPGAIGARKREMP